MTVLLWGVGTEPPMAMVGSALADLGADVVLVHPREAAATEIVVRAGGGSATVEGQLRVGPRTIDLAEVVGIYLRPVEPELVPELAGLPSSSPVVGHARKIHDALIGFTEVAARAAGARVLNRLSAMASNMSKPFQAQAVLRNGFSTPETVVTDDPDEAIEFATGFDRVIYKSTSGIRSIVTLFDPVADRERLRNLAWCPVQFQEFVSGYEIRVHVVGNETYAAQVKTTATDYRYARRQVGDDAELSAVTLEPHLAARCVALAADLDLPFAGLDLKIADDGRIVCFEVNPSPGFPWYETEAGLPISAAVARHLVGAS